MSIDPIQRQILLCATGLSPQVVTETVYAILKDAGRHYRMPDEIRLITTSEGAERARLWLLSAEPGWFTRLCRDWNLPPIDFDADSIKVIEDADGKPLADVRSAADNVAAADAITEQVRELTADPATALHVSLAGGRKTLGFFAGYALSLFGRAQDQLSHVLVSEPFESSPDFFYPTPYERIINVGRPTPKPVDCRNAEVTLADLPFVRLRAGMPERLRTGTARYAEAVAAAQPQYQLRPLQLWPAAGRVQIGEINVPLPPALMAFYWWFAIRARTGQPPLPRPSEHEADQRYAAEYLDILQRVESANQRTRTRMVDGMTQDAFDTMKSKLNGALKRHLGSHEAIPFLIRKVGDGRVSSYALPLAPSLISIEED
ncbi:MAG: CRISPR-associated ring nuclease Csm6 [Xanthomonadales bacterium]|jgi:CRISPR-associated protein (TIGR02584 family)|nr:CRISPR-associated ring nuclease Csm6 [Xanthomonadales bacterium]